MISHKKNLILTVLVILFNLSLSAQVTFVIESLPETTPRDDTIFISGTFNDWAVNDPNYILKKQVNGRFIITLFLSEGRHEYKFTRGSWMKGETGNSNEYIQNRVYENGSNQKIYIRILNWQDHGGIRKFSYMVFYYFLISFQTVVFIIFVLRNKKKSFDRGFWLHAMNVGLLILFLGIVCYNVFNPIWQTYLIILIQILIFLWGPLCYLFIRSISAKRPNQLWIHFLLVVLVGAIISLKFLNINPLISIFGIKYGRLLWQDAVLIGFGTFHATIYVVWMICQFESKFIRPIEANLGHNFIRLFLTINLTAQVALLLCLYLIFIDSRSIIFIEFHLPFTLLSLLVILETYFIWKHPKIFKQRVHAIEIEEIEELLEKIQVAMMKDKVYKNAELNINTLSEMLGTKVHILSKILNVHYHKSFRDFVNYYRVKEFVYLARSGELERYTYLGLAHEVGFNSKSTFNLAFKKNMKQNPRDFFKSEK